MRSDPLDVIFDEFQKAHPEETIKFSQYKEELPWNRKKAYRETCLDRVDVNFQWHRQALAVAMDMLSPLHSPSTADAEGDGATEAQEPDPLLCELAQLAALSSTTAFANQLVCSECLGDSTQQACLDSCCPKCSFARLWSKGLRPKVIIANTHENTETVRNDASTLWEKEISWDVVKSSDANEDDRDLRHTVTGTIVELRVPRGFS